jgi:hypothetical protein
VNLYAEVLAAAQARREARRMLKAYRRLLQRLRVRIP